MDTDLFLERLRELATAPLDVWRKAISEGLAASNCPASKNEKQRCMVVSDLCFSVRANLSLLQDVMLGWRVPKFTEGHRQIDYVMPEGETLPVTKRVPDGGTPLLALGIHSTAAKLLRKIGVETLEQLLEKEGTDLTAIAGFGDSTLHNLRRRLADYGLRLKDGIPAYEQRVV